MTQRKTPTLYELQKMFSENILGGKNKDSIEKLLSASDIPAEELMFIYRTNTVSAASHALSQNFPAVEKLVGENFFRKCVYFYLKENPPKNADLENLGERFPEFLAAFKPAKELAYLGDIALLEKAIARSTIAPAKNPMESEVLQGIDPDKLASIKVFLCPSVDLVSSNHPIYSIWGFALSNGKTDFSATDMQQAESVLIFKKAGNIKVNIINRPQYYFLKSLSDGKTIYEAFEIALKEDPEFDLAISLNAHMLNGVFCDISHT